MKSRLVRTTAQFVGIFRPTCNSTMSASNTGLRRLFYGGENSLGLHHLLTAGRFRKELLEYRGLGGVFDEAKIAKAVAVDKSIPKPFQEAFLDLRLQDKYNALPAAFDLDGRLVKYLAEKLSGGRKIYDKFIDKPIAKVRGSLYKSYENIKELMRCSKSKGVIDANFVRSFTGGYIKLPENLNDQNAKDVLKEILEKYRFSEKEIANILKGKSPRFYRFVDETELRALKKGEKICSTAEYHSDFPRCDITNDPNFIHNHSNKYRITFKKNQKMNLFNGQVSQNEPEMAKWHLNGFYDMNDVVCTERIYF